MATWRMAIPIPIKKSEVRATEKRGKEAKKRAPARAMTKAASMTRFSLYRSTRIPAGIDITP
jgi:hypothetical protein